MLYIGIDLGTSACKLLLVGEDGSILNTATKDYPLSFPHPSWSEQRPGYGAAILAMVGCGKFASVQEAADKLVEVASTTEPDAALTATTNPSILVSILLRERTAGMARVITAAPRMKYALCCGSRWIFRRTPALWIL